MHAPSSELLWKGIYWAFPVLQEGNVTDIIMI